MTAYSEISDDLRTGRLEQACGDCGLWEAAGAYCTGCRRPMGPDDWYRNGDETRRAVAHQRAAEKAQTRVKRPRGRPSSASVQPTVERKGDTDARDIRDRLRPSLDLTPRSEPDRSTLPQGRAEEDNDPTPNTAPGSPRRPAPTGSTPPVPVGAPDLGLVP